VPRPPRRRDLQATAKEGAKTSARHLIAGPTARSKSTSRGFARRLFANFPVQALNRRRASPMAAEPRGNSTKPNRKHRERTARSRLRAPSAQKSGELPLGKILPFAAPIPPRSRVAPPALWKGNYPYFQGFFPQSRAGPWRFRAPHPACPGYDDEQRRRAKAPSQQNITIPRRGTFACGIGKGMSWRASGQKAGRTGQNSCLSRRRPPR